MATVRLIAAWASVVLVGVARHWAETPKLRATLAGHTDVVYAVAFSPERVVASGSQDQTIKLWDVASGNELQSLAGHKSWVAKVAFLPGGKELELVSKLSELPAPMRNHRDSCTWLPAK